MIAELLAKILMLSLIPAGIFCLFLLRGQNGKKINRRFFFRLCLAGAFVVLPTAALVFVLSPFLGNGTVETLIVAIIEETAKYVLFIFLVFRHRNFQDGSAGPLFGAAIAIGFATAENILYLSGSGHLVPLIFLRAFTALPLHILCGGFMGYYAGRNRDREERAGITALLLPLLLHVSYNFLLKTPIPAMTLLLLSTAAPTLFFISRKTPSSK